MALTISTGHELSSNLVLTMDYHPRFAIGIGGKNPVHPFQRGGELTEERFWLCITSELEVSVFILRVSEAWGNLRRGYG